MQECGECTLCCKLLEIHDIPTPSPIESWCMYCEPGTGCEAYNTRPEECRQFQCMWSQMEHVGIELRPDKCHIIFTRAGEDVICARLEKDHKLSKLVMNQIKTFNKEGFSVLVFRGRASKYFLIKEHTKDYVRKIVHGRSKLHGRPDRS